MEAQNEEGGEGEGGEGKSPDSLTIYLVMSSLKRGEIYADEFKYGNGTRAGREGEREGAREKREKKRKGSREARETEKERREEGGSERAREGRRWKGLHADGRKERG